MFQSIEKYIQENGKYPPELIKFTAVFIPRFVLEKSKPIIMKKESIISGRRKKQSQDLSKTPAFMLFNRMYWGKGVLNAPGLHAGNSFDLATPNGMALFLHEEYHIYQWFRNPLKMIYQYIKAPFESLLRCGILFAHEVIPFEIEAIKFEHQMKKTLNQPEYSEKLKIFEKMR
ncbi:MAG: hypothetical protein GF364_07115 [Candidatus Lokiarchaeota archaeon]|nr:hypothetical protein [Candidatus Lokiarchaeota archaeon]